MLFEERSRSPEHREGEGTIRGETTSFKRNETRHVFKQVIL